MRRAVLTLACLAALSGGCMSTFNHVQFPGCPPDERPYGGVRFGAEVIGDNATAAARGQVKDLRELTGMTFMTVLCVIDLPFSAVADTLWLPHDLRVSRETRDRPPAESPESVGAGK
jgi:uncharacterized protein YceK